MEKKNEFQSDLNKNLEPLGGGAASEEMNKSFRNMPHESFCDNSLQQTPLPLLCFLPVTNNTKMIPPNSASAAEWSTRGQRAAKIPFSK